MLPCRRSLLRIFPRVPPHWAAWLLRPEGLSAAELFGKRPVKNQLERGMRSRDGQICDSWQSSAVWKRFELLVSLYTQPDPLKYQARFCPPSTRLRAIFQGSRIGQTWQEVAA